MMNSRYIFLLALTCQFLCLNSFAENKNDRNPLLANRWQRVAEFNGCADEITFAPNGKYTVISADELTEGTYSISEKLPSSFYKVTRKTTKDSGGVDCLGDSKDDTGKEFTYFIKFTPSGDHVGCTSEKLITCSAQYRVYNQSNADRKESLFECTKEQYAELTSNLWSSLQDKINYPKEARLRGWEGEAEVNVLINLAEGKLLLAELSKSSGYPILDSSLMDAISVMQIPKVNCRKEYSDFIVVTMPSTFKIPNDRNDILIDVKPYKF